MEGPRGAQSRDLPSLRALTDRVMRVGLVDQYVQLFHEENYDNLRICVDAGICVSHVGMTEGGAVLLISPLEFRDLLDRIGSPYVGCYFDTGNVVLYGYPEQWIRILGTRIKKIHFKDFKIDHHEQSYAWPQLMQGSVDWPAVMREIRAIGYDAYVITEVCGDRAVYAETCRVMDTILALP